MPGWFICIGFFLLHEFLNKSICILSFTGCGCDMHPSPYSGKHFCIQAKGGVV